MFTFKSFPARLFRSVSHRTARRFWRKVAPLVTLCFAWSFTLGPALAARADAPLRSPGHIRRLSTTEMRHILGANNHALSYSAASGPTYPWEGAHAGTNTGNETNITNANSTTVTRVFDAANRLTSVTNKNGGGTTLSSFTHSLVNFISSLGAIVQLGG